mmetsp:Transcript_22508/g.64002  ORF Transcript_22508/g.64002 Transcript_22508/m.64002 type:complete len:251 (-) Transcript_22508:102-854(-)
MGRDLDRQCARLALNLLPVEISIAHVLRESRHKAKGLGLGRVDQATCQQHIHGSFTSDCAHQRNRGGAAEQANAHARGGKARCGRRANHISGGHQLAAGCCGDSVHGGDDGLRYGLHELHDMAAQSEKLPAARLVAVLLAHHLLEVVAGAKHRPLALDDHGAKLVAAISLELFELKSERVEQVDAQRVALSRPVQSEVVHAMLFVAPGQERLGAHSPCRGDSDMLVADGRRGSAHHAEHRWPHEQIWAAV